MGAKVFISHSTKTEENREFLNEICQSLESSGFKVLVDKAIEPGKEWFPCLNEYLMECHGAVILLSSAALQSEWVKAEAAVLCARRRANSGIDKLILVPLETVTAEELDKYPFFKTIRLSDFQIIRDYQNAQGLAIKVNQSLNDLIHSMKPPPTPFDELTNKIRDVLKQLKAEPEILDRIWEETQENAQPGCDHADVLARTLLRDHKNIFPRLRELLERLAHILTKKQALTLIEMLKGHWVEPAAASMLCIAQETKQPVAINGNEITYFTGHCYSRKAWPYPKKYTLVAAADTDRTLPEIHQTLLKQIAGSCVNPRKAESKLARENPLLLIFPYSQTNNPNDLPDKSLIEDIQQKYQNITVVIETGPQIPEFLDYVLPLEPLLEDGLEEQQYMQFEDLNDFVNTIIAD